MKRLAVAIKNMVCTQILLHFLWRRTNTKICTKRNDFDSLYTYEYISHSHDNDSIVHPIDNIVCAFVFPDTLSVVPRFWVEFIKWTHVSYASTEPKSSRVPWNKPEIDRKITFSESLSPGETKPKFLRTEKVIQNFLEKVHRCLLTQ